MGMIYYLRQISNAERESLLADPDSIEALLDWENAGSTTTDVEVDLDKAWHGIHFLLTGSDWQGDEPLCFLLSSGETVGDVDVGYGPARTLTVEQVSAFARALNALSREDFEKRFDEKKLQTAEIYPAIWDEGKDALDYLVEYFGTLKTFVNDVSKAHQCLLLWIS